jgi:type II secretory pathway pseudopilin PulG
MRAEKMRPGLTLVEITVSLVLLLVLLSVGSLVARRSIQTLARVSTTELRTATLSDALRTLTRHVRNADPAAHDLRAAGDSVLDLVHTIGAATLCRVSRDTIVLPAPDDTLPWATTLPRWVTTDDAVRVWHDDEARWIERGIRSVAPASGVCGDSAAPWPGRAGQRLLIDDTIGGARPGAFVRVLQRERWSLVRGGDGQWSLALATWDALSRTFSTPQPVVAPLAAPTAPDGPGLLVRAVDAAGRHVADSGLADTRAVIVSLRSKQHARLGTIVDSVRINVGPH